MRPTNESLPTEDYKYNLPETAVASFPLAQRDQAKLLVYRQGAIQDLQFHHLPDQLPPNSQLFFNDTKVIPARLRFQKATTEQGPGAQIELFLLHPRQPSSVMSQAMAARGTGTWQCLVGNRRRWKPQQVLQSTLEIQGRSVTLSAEQASTAADEVVFSWSDPSFTFAEVVEAAGQVPLPPYLNREATEADRPRYQTVYSAHDGAVAAPTAGLHFTEATLEALHQRGVGTHCLTLHVSAGTFQPIKESDATKHTMHAEQLVINRKVLEVLLTTESPILAVGTTSLRTLESLYWYGVLLQQNPEAEFRIEQHLPYQTAAAALPSRQEAVAQVISYLDRNNLPHLVGETQLFIRPGYRLRVVQGLITNFHQPGSTLILLVAALIGEDWRKVYTHALQHQYRFLSYGDSSLLLP
ncbi:MAG: S-adenosylmethionine:tRNA ribosyltransferase-isomerase [Tunicatimonas sp.]